MAYLRMRAPEIQRRSEIWLLRLGGGTSVLCLHLGQPARFELFTFSHPAAVLPLRRYSVISALVIGSAGAHGELLRDYFSSVRFPIAFVITATAVAALEMFGFSVFWRIVLVRV